MIKVLFTLFLGFQIFCQESNLQYYCTAADSKSYECLLNLINSLHKTNFDNLYELSVFDLGFTHEQLTIIKKIEKVSVYEIEKSNWYKSAAIKKSLEKFPYVLWLNPESTVLQPLDNLFKYIQSNSYFLITIGDEYNHTGYKYSLENHTCKQLRYKFDLENLSRKWILSCEAISTNLMGFTKDVYNELVLQWYETSKNIVSDEQSLLTILAYIQGRKILRQDVTKQKPIYLDINDEQLPFYINSSLTLQ